MIEATKVVHGHSPLATEFGGVFEKFAVLPAIALVALGAIEPVVKVREEGVRFMLDVAGGGEFFVNDDGFGGAFDSVTSAEVEVVLVADEDAVFDEGDGAREKDFVEEDSALVGLAIIVGVFEDGDASLGKVFVVAVEVGHVTAHLDDPDAAVAIELESDWFFDERLGGDGLDDEAVGDGEGFEGFFDREHGRGWNEFLGDHGLHVAVPTVTVLRAKGGREED